MSLISSEVAPMVLSSADTKIAFIILDGLGGFANSTGKTELELADTPNLDRLAKEGATGLIDTLGRGIVPGSGLAHLALFGYDAFKHDIGRGAIAANGIGVTLKPNQVAARMNFCTAKDGNIVDRRAGRIPTEKSEELAKLLNGAVSIDGVKVQVYPVMDYRAVVVFEGDDLSIDIADTDPSKTGVPPNPVESTAPGAEKMVKVVSAFVEQAEKILANEHPANMIVLRGFAVQPDLAPMQECYGLKSACIATYPDYKGVARMIGMDVLKLETGNEIADEFTTLEKHWADYSFFFLHVKKTDSYGEDGNFDGRVHIIEETDREIPRLMALNPDVIVVTGDHSTPAVFSAHTWHPVPVLLWGQSVRVDETTHFGETEAVKGGLGRFAGAELMLDVLSHAGRTGKMGA